MNQKGMLTLPTPLTTGAQITQVRILAVSAPFMEDDDPYVITIQAVDDVRPSDPQADVVLERRIDIRMRIVVQQQEAQLTLTALQQQPPEQAVIDSLASVNKTHDTIEGAVLIVALNKGLQLVAEQQAGAGN